MKKYKVQVKTLERCNLLYTVEADSKEEAKELVKAGKGKLEYDDYDYTDQFDVINIEEYEN